MSDERDTLRERIAAAWSHARCSVAHDPSACSTCALFALLDSPVGEPEPHDCERWQTEGLCCALCNPVATMRGPLPEHDPYRRSKLPGAGNSAPIRSPESMAETMEAFVRNEAPHLLPFYQRPPVHNHGPEDGPSVACRETLIGDCMREQIARRARIEAYREAAEYLEEQMHVPTVAASDLLRQRADELEAGQP